MPLTYHKLYLMSNFLIFIQRLHNHILLPTLKFCFHITCKIKYDPKYEYISETKAYSKYNNLFNSLLSFRCFADIFSKRPIFQRILSIILTPYIFFGISRFYYMNLKSHKHQRQRSS